jgi:alkylhydroperoxidase family enzyme
VLAGRSRAADAVLPQPLAAFVDKVARLAYEVTDEDVEALRTAGYSEDAIFEAVVSTAAGAGLCRLAIGMAALGQEGKGHASPCS